MAKDGIIRQFKIMEILKRGQLLEKAQLEQLLGIYKGAKEGTGPAQALARDLNDLFDQGKLLKKYFKGDGSEISEDEAMNEKYKTVKWCLPGLDHSILGKGLLTSAGGSLFLSARLVKEISIWELKVNDRDNDLGIVFDLGPILRLKFSMNTLPLNMLICRASEDLNEELFRNLESVFKTKRLVILALPDKNISSIRDEKKPGHIFFEFDVVKSRNKERIKIKCTDLGSKNGSWISRELTDGEFKDRIADLTTSQKQTIDIKNELSKLSSFQFERLGTASVERNLPVIVNLSDSRVISIG